MARRLSALLTLVIVALVTSPLIVSARASRPVTAAVTTSASNARTSASQSVIVPTTAVAPATRDAGVLASNLQQLAVASGGTVGVSVVELGGSDQLSWSFGSDAVFTAASTYKLVALMMEAQSIAAGTTDPNGIVCFAPSDYEAGWFDDYEPGACFTRNELASRAAKQSDNTAGHMLVRDVGGADALNAWAAAAGAASSAFFVGNTTSPADLAVLWVAEASGELGGAAAQAWLYPLLTDTTTEAGVPAGTGAAATVVHKTGTIDAVENDAALVTAGPDGPYVLVVMTDGLGGDAGWQLIAAISAAVWQVESSRSQ
ncbi:MAG: serine hydrolase [Chloroflexi bacterium]|nr:MAG: serine hydrolase [Chloroflexota bacterium]